jgi:hypothetical protein
VTADLSRLLLLAYLDKLEQRVPLPPLRPAELPVRAPRLDDTGRGPFVPLRPTGGDGA